MIDTSQCNIDAISVHRIGNQAKEEDLILSEVPLEIPDTQVRDMLHRFFLSPFTIPEFYALGSDTQSDDGNPVLRCAERIFNDPEALHADSQVIARHLYLQSTHPQIKSGDLFVVLFSDIIYEDTLTDVIGIFKSESKQAFLQLDYDTNAFTIHGQHGMHVDKLDKGCLIFNTDKDSGYKVCIIDKSNNTTEAHYWKEAFLHLKPARDAYHHTRAQMEMTRHFVTEELPDELPLNRADQIDLLNRSADFYKTHDRYDERNFEKEVLRDDEVITAYRNFNTAYKQHNALEDLGEFDISPFAVKKQGRVLRSVLKLDKNFHIYIHGDRNLIEQGRDQDGRKFYKIYFEKEA